MENINYCAAKRLAVKARNSIGQYCMDECRSLCCREGTITITDNELKLMTKDRIIIPGSITIATNNDNKLNLKLGCPSFIEYKCAIHRNKSRPQMCKDFPLFIYGNNIVVAHDCPAVDAGKLFPYLHKFKKMGFRIIWLINIITFIHEMIYIIIGVNMKYLILVLVLLLVGCAQVVENQTFETQTITSVELADEQKLLKK